MPVIFQKYQVIYYKASAPLIIPETFVTKAVSKNKLNNLV
jgi:hypothetical protein